MKVERTSKRTVAKVEPQVSEVTLVVTEGTTTVRLSLSTKEAKKLGRALRDAAVIVSAGRGDGDVFD